MIDLYKLSRKKIICLINISYQLYDQSKNLNLPVLRVHSHSGYSESSFNLISCGFSFTGSDPQTKLANFTGSVSTGRRYEKRSRLVSLIQKKK